MDVHSLKNYIKTKPELIELILEKANFSEIDDNFSGGMEYRCAWSEGKNNTAVRVNKETLASNCFSRNIKGDIITLIQDKKQLPFQKAVKFIADVVNFNETHQEEYTLPFGGFYKKIKRFKENNGLELKVYDESILDQYLKVPNLMFYQDGIDINTQQEFNVGYDVVTQRITVPWRSTSGELIGIMGRKNIRDVEEGDNKWFPIIPFPKSAVIYGFSENYKSIQDKGIAFVGESEKFSLTLKSWGLPLGLSLGGSTMSENQANNIKSLLCRKTIIGMDEGLEKDISVEIGKKLKMNKFFKNTVYYINDKNNLYLPKGSKMSPTDLPKEDFKRLITHCLVEIE